MPLTRCYNNSADSMLFYSGTEEQPDLLTYFIKPKGGKNVLHFHALPAVTWVGYFPLISIGTGAARAVNAVQEIFKCLANQQADQERAAHSELWNAIKNLFKAIAEICPLTGLCLIIYDAIRNEIHFAAIKRQLEQQDNIAGVAIDGKVIATIDIGKIPIKGFPQRNEKDQLDLWTHGCSSWLCKQQKLAKSENASQKNINLRELFSRFIKQGMAS